MNLERIPGALASASARAQASNPYVSIRAFLCPHLPYVGAILLMALLAGLPLLQMKLMSGHDSLAYQPRYVEFYEGLRAGQIFPRWAPDLAAGYGEPTFVFNPPVICYLVAFFHALGANFIAAENLAFFALLVLAGLGMYLLAAEFFGLRGGLVAATAYLFAPYLSSVLYVRHSAVDFAAFPFIPLAFWGLYRFVEDGRYRFLIVGALSTALLFLSSSSVALMSFPALVLFLGVLVCANKPRWRVLIRGVTCLALGAGLAAFFVIPSLAETTFIHVSRRAERLNFRDHFVHWRQLIDSPWGYGLSIRGSQDGMSFAIGQVHLILTGVAALLLWRVREVARQRWLPIAFFLLLIGLSVFFTVDASRFVWERVSALGPLQFPWRFLSLTAMGTAFLCGLPFLFLEAGKERLANGLAAGLIGLLLLLNLFHARPQTFLDVTDADFTPQKIAQEGMATTARELEPIWVRAFPQSPAKEPLAFLGGPGRILIAQVAPAHRLFVVEIIENARLRLNTFYFPGWKLYVDGIERPIDYSNPQGVMEFSLGGGLHGVKFVFEDTPVRAWAGRLSLLALLMLVGVGLAGVVQPRVTPLITQVAAGLVVRRQGLSGAARTSVESETPKQLDESQ